MLPILLAGGVFAAVSMQRTNEETSGGNGQETEEDIESFFNTRARDRRLTVGKTLIAENSRIIRPEANGVLDPEAHAKAWDGYHRQYENVAKTLSSANYAGGDNARYFRGDINKRPRRPYLPDKESFGEWSVVPTSYFEYENHSGKSNYPDQDYSWYDDQFGEAIATPGAPHYIFTEQEFQGNPWGPQGQLFNTEGMRTKSAKGLNKDNVPAHMRKNKKVRFYGLPQ